MKKYPDISCKHEKISFDKDAQGAFEDIYEIKQNGELLTKTWMSYNPYDGKRESGVLEGRIIGYYPEHNLVKILWKNRHTDYFLVKEKRMADNSSNAYLYFLYPRFDRTQPKTIKTLSDLCAYLMTKITGNQHRFELEIPGPIAGPRALFEASSHGTKLRITVNTEIITPLLMRTDNDELYFELEIGFNSMPKQPGVNSTDHGYVVLVNLSSRYEELLGYLRNYFSINPQLKDYNQ